MEIVINDLQLALGATAPRDRLARAGLRRPGWWQRLLAGRRANGERYSASNCTAAAFGGDFTLYPCTDSYLTPDRRWHTDAELVLERGRIVTVEVRVVEGAYAADGFADRFAAACTAVCGEPQATDRYLTRWRNGSALITSILQPDTMNASFLFEWYVD